MVDDSPSIRRLEKLAELWRRERETTRERFAEERRGQTLAERVERGLALTGLVVDEAEAVAGGRLRLWLTPDALDDLDDLRVSTGDPVRLWWDDPDQRDAVLGVTARRTGQRLAVVVDEVPDRLWEGAFKLDRDAAETTFDRGDRAIARLSRARPGEDAERLREVTFGERAPERDDPADLVPFDTDLNGPQLEAVRHALASRDLALVHGPPGTGKTRTLVEVIRQAVARGDRVLATAASNTAVDNLAERLAALGVDVVRLGHPARVSPAMEARTLDALAEQTEAWDLAHGWIAEANELRRRAEKRYQRGQINRRERRGMLAEARRLTQDARRQLSSVQDLVLERCPVACATAAGADAALLRNLRFDLVVLDEATQAPDPMALVALGRAPRAVLAGDPRQLPPTVIDPEAERRGLGVTIFERVAERHPDAVRMLEVQHRMHEDLMRFPSQSMYDGRLVADASVAQHRLEDLGVAPDPGRPGPLVFVDTAGRGWDDTRSPDDPSTHNPGNAEHVAGEVRRLVRRGVAPSDVAVITPYEAQARALRELLRELRAEGLEVGTVDGFQGREKEAIVVDLVRSNPDGEIGFLRDVRRMNVALTRARRFLLVVGDSATLAGDRYYRAFLDAAELGGTWLSAWTADPDAPL